MENQVEYRELTDVVTGKKFYMKVGIETPEEYFKSHLPWVFRQLYDQMKEEQPERLAEKMAQPELFLKEMMALVSVYSQRADNSVKGGMNYLEAMAESRQRVAAMLGL